MLTPTEDSDAVLCLCMHVCERERETVRSDRSIEHIYISTWQALSLKAAIHSHHSVFQPAK